LDVVDIVTSGPHRFESSIADAARNIATRAHSWMWDVADDDWKRIAAQALERLRSARDFERRVWRDAYQEVLVLKR